MTTEATTPSSTSSLYPTDDPIERRIGISLQTFPLLRKVLDKHGEALRSELLEFAHALHYKRATRVRRNLVARIFVENDYPEVAVVRDVSESGVRLWMDGDQSLDASRQEPYRLEVKVPGSRNYLAMQAQLVRVVEHRGERGLELAFRFTSPLEVQALQQLIARVSSD